MLLTFVKDQRTLPKPLTSRCGRMSVFLLFGSWCISCLPLQLRKHIESKEDVVGTGLRAVLIGGIFVSLLATVVQSQRS